MGTVEPMLKFSVQEARMRPAGIFGFCLSVNQNSRSVIAVIIWHEVCFIGICFQDNLGLLVETSKSRFLSGQFHFVV